MAIKRRAGHGVLLMIVLCCCLSHVSATDLMAAENIMEGTSREVCVELTENLENAATVRISTTPIGSQALPGVDYEILAENLQFNTNELRKCVQLVVLADDIVENQELFIVGITSEEIPVSPTLSSSFISIVDTNRVLIAFEQSEYTAEEMNPVSVCAVIVQGSIDRMVTFRIATRDGTATSVGTTFDYIATNIELSFTSDMSRDCTFVSIQADLLVEEDEYFEVVLSSDLDAVDIDGTSRVTITDDDGATLSLVSSVATITEGDVGTSTVDLCVRLNNANGGLRRDIPVTLMTTPQSADDEDFEMLTNDILVIPSSTAVGEAVCRGIVIFNDLVAEGSEIFRVIVNAANSNDQIFGVLRVTIRDNGDVLNRCERLDGINNGQLNIEPDTRLQGSIANYTCNMGFEASDGSTVVIRTCLTTGVWQGSEPTCSRVDCGSPPTIAQSSRQGMMTTFESQVIYMCSEGHDLSIGGITFTIMCQANGMWSDANNLPTCQPVDCGSPPTIAQSTRQGMMTTFESEVVYMCTEGYDLSLGGVTFTIMCQANGMWSDANNLPTCQPVDCGNLLDIPNGQVSLTTTTLGSTATYSCDSNYQLNREQERICQSNGMWSDNEPSCLMINCPILTDPTNGQIEFSQEVGELEIATYSCENGYMLDGNTVRNCQQDGTWSGSDPTCESVDCGALSDPSDGNVDFTETTFEAGATYTCNNGYNLVGNGSRVCEANGQWSGSEPQCEIVTCGELDSPINGTVNTITLTFGSNATYSCIEGYKLNGQEVRTCLSTGNWSGSAPMCVEEVFCEELSISGGRVSYSDQLRVGSIATASCDPELLLEGSQERTCQESGEWSGDEAQCVNPPTQGALGEDNTDMVIAIAVGVGLGSLILIVVIGTVVVALLVIRRKKIYRKYVLPYRTYIYANSNSVRHRPGGGLKDNDIQQFENDTRSHALDAVEALDRPK